MVAKLSMTKLLVLLLLTGCVSTKPCPIEECYFCGDKRDIEYRCKWVWDERIEEIENND
jgi:hypothetical protein